jgi:CDP-glycerol glycerophosphotransferase
MRIPKILLSFAQITLHRIFCLFPVNRRVVFIESFIGLSYACNPKYIYEEMLRQELPMKYVWSMQDKHSDIPGHPLLVRRFSVKYYYHLATAKYLISNTEFAQNLYIRSQQIYLNTQHGTPLKKMGRHQPDDRPNRKPKTGRWSFLLTQNRYSTDIFRDAYLYHGEVLEYGHPRNDPLFKRNSEVEQQQIKKQLGLPLDKTVIMYAPTWRRDHFDLHLDIEKFAEIMGEDFVLILRLHHLVSSRIVIDKSLSDLLFNFSSARYDIQELFLISDLLVTDYSSIIFDYANLGRPIVFYTYDYESYKGVERGLYLDLADIAPGQLVDGEAGLLHLLKNEAFTDEYRLKYHLAYTAFRHRFCALDDGNSSARVVSRLLN